MNNYNYYYSTKTQCFWKSFLLHGENMNMNFYSKLQVCTLRNFWVTAFSDLVVFGFYMYRLLLSKS